MPLLPSFLVYVPKYTQYASGVSSDAPPKLPTANAARAAAVAARRYAKAIPESSVVQKKRFPTRGGGLMIIARTPGSPKPEDGWIDLMKPDVWKKFDPAWIVTNEVKLDSDKGTKLVAEKADGGPVWVNGPKGRLPDLVTKQEFGDCEVHVEFLIA